MIAAVDRHPIALAQARRTSEIARIALRTNVAAHVQADTIPDAIRPGFTLREALLNSSELLGEKPVYRACIAVSTIMNALKKSPMPDPRSDAFSHRRRSRSDGMTHRQLWIGCSQISRASSRMQTNRCCARTNAVARALRQDRFVCRHSGQSARSAEGRLSGVSKNVKSSGPSRVPCLLRSGRGGRGSSQDFPAFWHLHTRRLRYDGRLASLLELRIARAST